MRQRPPTSRRAPSTRTATRTGGRCAARPSSPASRPTAGSRGSAYHGYWALDADGTKGDPIFAAGAGVFHVGSVGAGCRASDTSEDDGTWAWVDHGAGVVTRYHHLLALTAREGEYVTPATQIATMGVSGTAPCTTAYLHLEVRHGGVKGTRVDPGQAHRLRRGPGAAVAGRLGAEPRGTRCVSTRSPASRAGSCVTPGWTSTPARPGGVRALRGSGSATVTWPKAPAGTDSVTIATSTYHPSVPEWGAPTYRVRSGSATRLGLHRAAERPRTASASRSTTPRAAGSSSAWVTVVPAAKPSVPRSPRWLTATIHQVRFAWYKSTEHGTPTTSLHRGPAQEAVERLRAVDDDEGVAHDAQQELHRCAAWRDLPGAGAREQRGRRHGVHRGTQRAGAEGLSRARPAGGPSIGP
nr:peptidoglycan DD-metalloendopeptidase family protein [Angustibacter aerolatus]